MTLEDLHEAVLEKIELDWATGVVAHTIDVYYGGEGFKVLLRGLGLQEFYMPRAEPWGPSTSIEYVLCDKLPPYSRLTVKMQSGDVLHMVVESYSIERLEPPSAGQQGIS